MNETVRIVVGGNVQDDAAAFIAAWEQAERGPPAPPERVFSFESWEGLASVMTGDRYRLLRHLHAHPGMSVPALAQGVGRAEAEVESDVAALADAGLIDRDGERLRPTADRIIAEVRLDSRSAA